MTPLEIFAAGAMVGYVVGVIVMICSWMMDHRVSDAVSTADQSDTPRAP